MKEVYMVVYSDVWYSDVECRCYGIYSTLEKAQKIADKLHLKYAEYYIEIHTVKVDDEEEVFNLI